MAFPGLMNAVRGMQSQKPPPKFSAAGGAGASPAGMMGGKMMAPGGGGAPGGAQFAARGNTSPAMAGRVGSMMGGRGAPGGGPTGGMAGRVAGMFGGGGRTATSMAAPGGAPGGAMGRIGGMFGGGGGRAPAPQMAPRAPGGMGGLFALSDERSKDRIRELEDQRDMYLDLLETDRDAVSETFRGVGNYDYDYKPEHRAETGVKSGRGPMADELRPLGVTSRGRDGLERVDMQRLPLETAGEVGTQRRELDDTRAEVDRLRAELAELEDDPDATLRRGLGRR